MTQHKLKKKASELRKLLRKTAPALSVRTGARQINVSCKNPLVPINSDHRRIVKETAGTMVERTERVCFDYTEPMALYVRFEATEHVLWSEVHSQIERLYDAVFQSVNGGYINRHIAEESEWLTVRSNHFKLGICHLSGWCNTDNLDAALNWLDELKRTPA